MSLDKEALQKDLLVVFKRYGVSVGVGLIASGVAIRSQDERVDARNLGPVSAYREEAKLMGPLKVGDVLYGFCGGAFGRDSYEEKRVEAIGADWVVVRGGMIGRNDVPDFYHGDPEELTEYRTPHE